MCMIGEHCNCSESKSGRHPCRGARAYFVLLLRLIVASGAVLVVIALLKSVLCKQQPVMLCKQESVISFTTLSMLGISLTASGLFLLCLHPRNLFLWAPPRQMSIAILAISQLILVLDTSTALLREQCLHELMIMSTVSGVIVHRVPVLKRLPVDESTNEIRDEDLFATEEMMSNIVPMPPPVPGSSNEINLRCSDSGLTNISPVQQDGSALNDLCAIIERDIGVFGRVRERAMAAVVNALMLAFLCVWRTEQAGTIQSRP